ncbi:MAG: Sec-independent protein translocase protein TatB [Woeseiaceae bacterium]
MFDIGFWEIAMISVIGLVVIGPDKLPEVARTAGKWIGRARRFVGDVKSDIDRELKQDEIRKALSEDAGLDELKEIMNSDNFRIDVDDTPDYQVSAIDDDFDDSQDVELRKITDHGGSAEDDPDFGLENEANASSKNESNESGSDKEKA